MARRPLPRLLPGWIAGAILAAAPLLSREALADEPTPSETSTSPDVYPPPHAQPNLILIGAGITAGWYGAAFGLSYLWPDSPGASALRIPVAGPYMSLAKTGCRGESNCGTFTLVIRTILTTLTAVGQTGGVLAMVEGVFLPTAARSERAPPRSTAQSSHLQLSLTAPPLLGLPGPVSGANPSLDPDALRTSPGGVAARRNASANADATSIFGVTLSGNF